MGDHLPALPRASHAANVTGDAVVVPQVELTSLRIEIRPEDVDHPHSRLHQPARKEEALAILIATVTVADARGFERQVKRPTALGAGKHGEGAVIVGLPADLGRREARQL